MLTSINVRTLQESDANYFDGHDSEVWRPRSQEQYGYGRQHFHGLQSASSNRRRRASNVVSRGLRTCTSTGGLRLRASGGDGTTTTPEKGSQTSVVDVEDCLRQEIRDDEQKYRVDGRLKRVPRRAADSERVVAAAAAVVSRDDVKVDGGGCSDDDR